jgi:hypothetical protein
VLIAPWLAITARHVVDGYIDEFGGAMLQDGSLDPQFQIFTTLVIGGGEQIIPLSIGRIERHAYPIMDIAAIELLPAGPFPEDYVWKLPTLDLLPPPLGAQVTAFGYANSRVSPPTQEKQNTLDQYPTMSTGEVVEVHHHRRDSSNLRFPCFRTNARFDGGMSGGPVYSKAGHICGIVCSNMPPMLEEDEHISYVSMLWPGLGISIRQPWVRQPAGTTLYELAAAGVIQTIGLEKLQVTRNPDGSLAALGPPGA